MDFVGWAPILSAFGGLGVGGVVVGWVGSAKSRRETRSETLRALGATENLRWAQYDYSEFRNATRELETAALIARIPRDAVRHYLVLAEAGRRLSDDSFERHDGDVKYGAGYVDAYLVDLIRDSAEVITRLAWNPWRTRLKLGRDLNGLRTQALEFDEPDIQRRLATGQQTHGTLPGELGEMPNIRLPPQFVELPQSK